jgi:hypothetical protein
MSSPELNPQRWGLRYSTVEGVVCLMQIAGGGRLRVRCNGREYWSRRPSGAAWEAYPAATGETFASKEQAEQVIANLST